MSVSLSQSETQALLQDVGPAYHTQINDLLLTGLVEGYRRWSGEREMLVDFEGHGREEEVVQGVDISRTVGRFVTFHPVRLRLSQDWSMPGDNLKAIKEQLRQIPQHGIGYGLLRYLSGNREVAERLRALPHPLISFNYLGQVDKGLSGVLPLQKVRETSGRMVSGRVTFMHLLTVTAKTEEGRLQVEWHYSRNLHKRSSIEALAGHFIEALRSLISHCLSPGAGGYTPSDFPLARLTQQQLDQIVSAEPLIEDLYPLTPMQQGILFQHLYAPEANDYFLQMVWRIHRELNPELFRKAWQEVAANHPSLRTAFIWGGLEEPLQVVRRQVSFEVAEHDWRRLSSIEQENRLRAFLEADQQRRFDFSQAPLMRAALLRTSPSSYYLVLSYSHLLVDGWTLADLLKDVLTVYQLLLAGHPAELEERRPYRDYVAWLGQQDSSAAEAFWREELRGFDAPTPLPLDGSASHREENGVKQEHQILLSVEATAELQALARRYQLTLNTVLQGAWALLLSRYSGFDDVVFGATLSARPSDLKGADSMVGLFLNTLPVRIQVPENVSVASWLQMIQAHQAAARQYDYSHLVQVQGWSDVRRGLPLFESVMVFENHILHLARKQSDSLDLEYAFTVDQTHYPLTLFVVPRKELELQFSYSTGRFDQTTIAHVAQHLLQVLDEVIAHPLGPLSSLSLLSPSDLCLLSLFNQTSAPLPDLLSLPQLFLSQVGRSPLATALISDDQLLSYAELNAAANQLARHLRQLGVGSESVVGVCLPRSIQMVVALLAVLKAGAAYLPLDAEYPPERLRLMMTDSGARVVVTEARLRQRVESSVGEAVVVSVDEEAAEISGHSGEELAVEVRGENLAYVIYTSGSTGVPKGVGGTHRAALNRFNWMWQTYPFDADEVCCLKTSLNFVDSIWEIFGPLLKGIKSVIIPDHILKDPRAFVRALDRYRVTRIILVPSLLRALLESCEDLLGQLSMPKIWTVSGEALPIEMVQTFYKTLPGSTLLNLYGSSEVAADVTWHEVQASGEEAARVSIGCPISNTQIYLLDQHLRLVPPGLPGEIYVGGASLARGYLGQPGPTAERFIPHPWSQEAGARLYKTGDLARHLPDGQLEFIGRRDHQVKVRGHRIELGEIEAALRNHYAVRESVVLARQDASGEKRLEACVVLHQQGAVSVGELHRHLKLQLPEYMLPSAFVFLDSMPLTPSGKIDRLSLPAAEQATLVSDAEFVAPRTPIEETLAGIYAQTLHLERIGIHDNFFDLGGHSLLAMQVLSRIHQNFQLEVPLRNLFDSPTVASLAEYLQSKIDGIGDGVALAIGSLPRDGRLPLSFAQQRLWFLEQMEGTSAVYNLPLAVSLSGELDLAALSRSFTHLIGRHESLRTVFRLSDGQPLQLILPAAQCPLPLLDLSALPPHVRQQEVTRLAQQQARRPFDLSTGPLLRLLLLRLAEDEHVLLLTMHHIISDGWSMGVLVREVMALYEAELGGTSASAELAPLPIQYADYAHWQREWLTGERLGEQLSYWREQLAGAPQLLDLPTDHPRPAVQSYRGATHSFVLDEELSRKLKALSRREGVTLFMVLLGAYGVLLSRYSGTEEVVVGTPVAGRTRMETEGLIGFFVNTLALRVKVQGERSFREVLEGVRRVALGGYEHQELPFEKLVEELQPERDLSRNPLFQVMLVLQNTPQEIIELPGLTLKTFAVDRGASMFDLRLEMREVGDRLEGWFEYNTDLFEPLTIEQLCGHFSHLLQQISASAELPLSALSLLSQAERQLQLQLWNDTHRLHPLRHFSIPQLFERQVDLTPDAPALIFAETELSYAQLNAEANQLAHLISAYGIGHDAIVALSLPRSSEMVIALLAILKAGAAYLPLEPDYPPERLSFMLKDAGASLLLTLSSLRERFAAALSGTALPVIALDQHGSEIQTFSSANPPPTVEPLNLAYVIYTSGSTGQPKAAMNTHQAITNRLLWMQSAFNLSSADAVLQKTPFSFDVSVWEFFWPLMVGARLVLARPGGQADPQYLST